MLTAYAVPFTVLPSSIWRIVMIFSGAAPEGSGDLPAWLPLPVYVIALSIFSELLAFTAVGLVATWGEVCPRWIPLLGGRAVPPLAAVIPAAVGALVLSVGGTFTLACIAVGVTITGEPLPPDFPTQAGGLGSFTVYVAYAPLVLWGPLLAVLTVHYGRRRRAASSPYDPRRGLDRAESASAG